MKLAKPFVLPVLSVVLLVLVLSAGVRAVEAKEIGSSTVSLRLQWTFSGNVDGLKTFKTFGFPNASFQRVSVEADSPFRVEQDAWGNGKLAFEWSDNAPKTIAISAAAKVNYDVQYVPSGSLESDSRDFMRKTDLIVVDDAISSQAKLLSEGASSDFEKLVRFTNWVHNNVVYDDSFWKKQPTSADVLVEKRGVCNQYSLLLMALLRSAGIPSRFVAGWVYSGKDWGPHAWTEALVDGKWVPADATYGEVGYLDGSHIVFAYGLDQRDISEELSKGLLMDKPKPLIELAESKLPRAFFSLSVQAPGVVGSSASEKIIVTVKNRDSRPVAIPLLLTVPEFPEELAVKLAEDRQQLVFLPPLGTAKVEWNALFPVLKDGFEYSFDVQAFAFGMRENASIKGEATPSASKQNIVLTKLAFSQEKGLAIVAELTNSGNAPALANVSVSIGSSTKVEQITLAAGERQSVRFEFANPFAERNGILKITTAAGSVTQPFEISEAQAESPAPTGITLPAGLPWELVAGGVGALLFAALLFAVVKRRNTA